MATIIGQNDAGEGKPRRQRASTGGSRKGPGAEITALQAQLREKEELLQAKDAALTELEESVKARIDDLENQLREKDELLIVRGAQLEALQSEADGLIQEMSRDKGRMLLEIEKLASELQEKKIALAKLEEHEWRSIGRRNSLKRRFGKLGKLFAQADDDEEDRKTNERLPLRSR